MTTPDTERALFVAEAQLDLASHRRDAALNNVQEAYRDYTVALAEWRKYEAEVYRLKAQSK